MKTKNNTYVIVIVALMIALEVILNRFAGITTEAIHVGIDFLPIVVVAMLFGPLWAGIAYAIGDLIGALLFPYGAINPGITITLALVGMTYGIVFYRKDLSGKKIIWRSLIASLITAVPIKLFGTTLALALFYGTPYNILLVTRIPNCAIFFVAQMILIPIIYKLVVSKLPIYKPS